MYPCFTSSLYFDFCKCALATMKAKDVLLCIFCTGLEASVSGVLLVMKRS